MRRCVVLCWSGLVVVRDGETRRVEKWGGVERCHVHDLHCSIRFKLLEEEKRLIMYWLTCDYKNCVRLSKFESAICNATHRFLKHRQPGKRAPLVLVYRLLVLPV